MGVITCQNIIPAVEISNSRTYSIFCYEVLKTLVCETLIFIYPSVPPTVILSIFRVGCPTPTGTD
jgi:hypothetical protein